MFVFSFILSFIPFRLTFFLFFFFPCPFPFFFHAFIHSFIRPFAVVLLIFYRYKVARLYRHSLKLLTSWAIDRDIVNEEATKLRAQFDAERGCKPEKAARLLREGNDQLFLYTHPDPYCNPVMPGGSKFMRNPPLRKSLMIHRRHEKVEELAAAAAAAVVVLIFDDDQRLRQRRHND